MNRTFPRSGILVLGSNSVQSLLPSTLISQIESLLENHKLEDAYGLVDQRRKKLEESLHIDEEDAEELCYVYQRIGFQCFTETLFDDAGKHLFNGELDPRLLISYYPDLRGSLFSPDDTIDAFAGIAEHMPTEVSVDDIIRNYSPHIAPTSPPAAGLRKILGLAAREMLLEFLKKSRTRRNVAKGKCVGSTGESLDIVIDTVLVKLYAEFEKTKDLHALLQTSNDVCVREVELILRGRGQYNVLCTLYKQKGDDAKLLDAWSKLIDGQWTDKTIQDPLESMVNLIVEKRDRTLSQHWGIWMIKRNPEQGLKLLMPRDTGKRRERPEEDIALLDQIQAANPVAAAQFLEYLILQRRSSSRELHMRLARTWIQHALDYLKDEAVSKLWRAKASSYASTRNEVSFLSYFNSTTPDSQHKRARLKAILLLASSSLYETGVIRQQLLEHENLLKFELAIVESKLGNHKSALRILAQDINDSTSAEAYCTLGGDVVPSQVALTIAEECGVQEWATMLLSLPSANGVTGLGATSLTRTKTVNGELKKELLRILLEVYMDARQPERAAQLINAQAVNLNILDIMALAPSDWPLNTISPFLCRSYRRILHTGREGKVVKNITAGQNLEVKDRVWPVLRNEGAIIEEAADDDASTEEEGEQKSFDEKRVDVFPENVVIPGTGNRLPLWMTVRQS